MKQEKILNYTTVAGSVPGTSHITRMKNNQDAMKWYVDESMIVAIVSDGCSASNEKNIPHYNEIGSHILTNICIKTIVQYIKIYGNEVVQWQFLWDRITSDILAQVKVITSSMDDDFTAAAKIYFQATLMGYIITPKKTIVFGCGDGMYAINGDITIVTPPADGNYPPYIIYSLIGSSVYNFNDSAIRLQQFEIRDTDTIENICIGTDGVVDLINAAEKSIPGQNTIIGPLENIWTDKTYITNPFWLQNRLSLYNTAKAKRDSDNSMVIHKGLLQDDTTIILTIKNKEQ
jgi:hypothetical protein